ncbi:DNA polymerase III gamma and tau subunits [Staphylococcus cohnii]|nr:DNA polymerase III gamma and tau subunits [Staphylococcus cohnii]
MPADQWMRVRTEYLQNRKQSTSAEENRTTTTASPEEVDVVQKAKDLFGENTVNVIDEE